MLARRLRARKWTDAGEGGGGGEVEDIGNKGENETNKETKPKKERDGLKDVFPRPIRDEVYIQRRH